MNRWLLALMIGFTTAMLLYIVLFGCRQAQAATLDVTELTTWKAALGASELPLWIEAAPAPGLVLSWLKMSCFTDMTEQGTPLPETTSCVNVHILLQFGPSAPPEHIKLVVAHEIQHYLRFKQNPRDYATMRLGPIAGRIAEEWRADAAAAEAVCRLGFPALDWAASIYRYMRDMFDYRGDAEHGTTDDRMAYTKQHAPACGGVAAPGAGHVAP